MVRLVPAEYEVVGDEDQVVPTAALILRYRLNSSNMSAIVVSLSGV